MVSSSRNKRGGFYERGKQIPKTKQDEIISIWQETKDISLCAKRAAVDLRTAKKYIKRYENKEQTPHLDSITL